MAELLCRNKDSLENLLLDTVRLSLVSISFRRPMDCRGLWLVNRTGYDRATIIRIHFPKAFWAE